MQQGHTPFWIVSNYIALAAISVAMTAHGFINDSPLFAVGGLLAFIIVACTAPLGVAAHEEPARGAEKDAAVTRELLAAVRELTALGGLSDDARRVMNRGRERELLRNAIEEDIGAEDWDAAMVLVKELAERFGYRADAEGFRHRIENARFNTVQRRVGESIAGLDMMISELRWDEASDQAARITRLYPDSDRVSGLRHRVEAAQDRYKQDLERRFLHAAEADRVDDALALLKELDQYLTEAEAAPFQELARGVIGKARENLGVRFKLALHDQRWSDAVEAGERIVDEFPNTRMAEEIRGAIEEIRSRAGSPA